MQQFISGALLLLYGAYLAIFHPKKLYHWCRGSKYSKAMTISILASTWASLVFIVMAIVLMIDPWAYDYRILGVAITVVSIVLVISGIFLTLGYAEKDHDIDD